MSDTAMITIVSGLPRSGTSMMMQLLAAGGLSLLTDEVRAADSDNPLGYYEFEPVKKLKADSSWLANAEGRAVKVIAQLLAYLPEDYEYRVLFMHRDLEEVLTSQEAMLRRLGKSGAKLSRDQLGKIFSNQLAQVEAFLDRQENIKTLNIHYAEMVQQPDVYLTQLIDFLDMQLDVKAMKAAIDPQLYRNK